MRADVAEVIMRYVTLDGRYARIFSYQFVILNPFKHDRKISIPFYLLSSLKHSLEKHAKNVDNPVLHEGLIHLILNYAKAHEVKSSPILNTHVSSSKLEV